MQNLLATFQLLVALTQQNMPFILSVIGVLWGVHLVNFILGYRLNYLGILPRSIFHIPGIAFSPFLHGNFNHLFFNTIPLFVLMILMLLGGLQHFYIVTGAIVVMSGAAVWLFGRPGLHVGASGVIMGYWGYLLMNAYHQPSLISVILAVVSFYYFGGFLMSLIPGDVTESFEGHIFGCGAGIAASYFFPMF